MGMIRLALMPSPAMVRARKAACAHSSFLCTTVNSPPCGTPATKPPLPKDVHEAIEWKAATEALMLVATLGGPTMFARIGIMRALNRHVDRVSDTSRKGKYWGGG